MYAGDNGFNETFVIDPVPILVVVEEVEDELVVEIDDDEVVDACPSAE